MEIRFLKSKKYITNILKYSAISEVLQKNIWTFFMRTNFMDPKGRPFFIRKVGCVDNFVF